MPARDDRTSETGVGGDIGLADQRGEQHAIQQVPQQQGVLR